MLGGAFFEGFCGMFSSTVRRDHALRSGRAKRF